MPDQLLDQLTRLFVSPAQTIKKRANTLYCFAIKNKVLIAILELEFICKFAFVIREIIKTSIKIDTFYGQSGYQHQTTTNKRKREIQVNFPGSLNDERL